MINRDQDRFKLKPINDDAQPLSFDEIKKQTPSIPTKKTSTIIDPSAVE